MSNEKVKKHIENLRNRHYHLELEINRLVHVRAPNEDIVRLKKEKLHLKEEIESLEKKVTT